LTGTGYRTLAESNWFCLTATLWVRPLSIHLFGLAKPVASLRQDVQGYAFKWDLYGFCHSRGSKAQLYFQLASRAEDRLPAELHSGGNAIQMIARLKLGATLAQAQSQIDAQNAALGRYDPRAKMMADTGFRTLVVPLPCRSGGDDSSHSAAAPGGRVGASR
jgi:hypothetical protein